MAELVKSVARQINIPFTIGGGINEIADADILLNSGPIRSPSTEQQESANLS